MPKLFADSAIRLGKIISQQLTGKVEFTMLHVQWLQHTWLTHKMATASKPTESMSFSIPHIAGYYTINN